MLLDRGAEIEAKDNVSNRIHVWMIVCQWLHDIGMIDNYDKITTMW